MSDIGRKKVSEELIGDDVMIRFGKAEADDLAGILDVAENLPEWFDEDARGRAIPIDIKYQTSFVALKKDKIVGFITLFVNEGRLNIGWIGVKKGFQRQGIGRQLLSKAEELAAELGLREIATSTLGDSVDYPPYEATRQFYFKQGFQIYMRSQTDNPGCPEEIYISKKLS